MTPKELEAIGCNKMHWNPNWNGGYFEYYLSIRGEGWGIDGVRLTVSFGDLPYDYRDRTFLAWLVMPQVRYALSHVTIIEQFKLMYTLLTGKQL